MAFHYRKHLSDDQKCSFCYEDHPIAVPPPPPRPHHLSPTLIVIFCVFGAAFLLVSCLVFVKRYYSNLNNSRMRNRPTFDDDDREDFVDENHGPVIDHHIWYINTVGLQPSVIESIAVFKYKKDEGLIEGTDCPVCLNEFQEDETLRLLPKCSHAFHIPCIDTWLRSHQNCPLCRAPIVSDANSAHLSESSEPNLNHLGPREENPVENLENYGHRVGGSGGTTSEIGVGRTESFGRLPPSEQGTIAAQILTKDSRYFNANNCDNRVLSDLTDHRAKVKDEMQPVRRSISMDDLSASRIYLAVAANIHGVVELEGCSSTRLVQVKKPNSEKVSKGGGVSSRNSSISSTLKKSPSVGCSLQKGHHVANAMKRSFSSSGKFTLPRRSSRSQDSILPLTL